MKMNLINKKEEISKKIENVYKEIKRYIRFEY